MGGKAERQPSRRAATDAALSAAKRKTAAARDAVDAAFADVSRRSDASAALERRAVETRLDRRELARRARGAWSPPRGRDGDGDVDWAAMGTPPDAVLRSRGIDRVARAFEALDVAVENARRREEWDRARAAAAAAKRERTTTRGVGGGGGLGIVREGDEEEAARAEARRLAAENDAARRKRVWTFETALWDDEEEEEEGEMDEDDGGRRVAETGRPLPRSGGGGGGGGAPAPSNATRRSDRRRRDPAMGFEGMGEPAFARDHRGVRGGAGAPASARGDGAEDGGARLPFSLLEAEAAADDWSDDDERRENAAPRNAGPEDATRRGRCPRRGPGMRLPPEPKPMRKQTRKPPRVMLP